MRYKLIRYKFLLYFLIAGFIVTGSLTSQNKDILKTPHAPAGILSLEWTSSNKSQDTLLQEWKNHGIIMPVFVKDSTYKPVKIMALSVAITDTHHDYYFILAYVSLAVFLIWRHRKKYRNWFKPWMALSAAAGAGLADCIQDVYELRSMHIIDANAKSSGLATWVFIPTLLYGLIALTLVMYYRNVLRSRIRSSITGFFARTSQFGSVLWRFRIVVIGLLFIFIAFMYVDQGTDLLMAINLEWVGVALMLFLFTALATLNWYFPKVYDVFYENPDNAKPRNYIDAANNDYQNDPYQIKTYLTRIIGSLTLIVPGIGILNAMTGYHVSYLIDFVSPIVLLGLMIFLYIQIIRFDLLHYVFIRSNRKAGTFRHWVYWTVFTVIMGFVLFSFSLGITIQSSLAYIAFDFFLLSLLFFITVTYRTWIRLKTPFVQLLLAVICICITFFILFNVPNFTLWATRDMRIFSLPFVIAGIITYTALCSVLLTIDLRFKLKIITVVFILGFSIAINKISAFHMVQTQPIDPASKRDTEYTLKNYVLQWLKSRRDEIGAQASSRKDYPVFFVNAYGGGIKATAWTTMVVGTMDSLLYADRSSSGARPDFQHYVFSYSGASGGSIGLSLLSASRMTGHSGNAYNPVFRNGAESVRFYKHDFLTFDLVGILGRDFWMGSSGFNWYRDRAALTEWSWEQHCKRYNIPYDTLIRLGWIDPCMEVPLYVSNTYDIDKGAKAILAPVKLDATDFPGSFMIQTQLKGKDIHLSSMAFLSARFPFVSPTGKLDENHHYTDGGTIENSGAETSRQLINVFTRITDSLSHQKGKPEDTIFKYTKICILSIPNTIPAFDSVERVRNLYETSAPIAGILNTLGGNAMKADSDNQVQSVIAKWHYFRMAPTYVVIDHGKIHPVLPLGWQISDYGLELMLASARRIQRSPLYEIRNLFREDFPLTPVPASPPAGNAITGKQVKRGFPE